MSILLLLLFKFLLFEFVCSFRSLLLQQKPHVIKKRQYAPEQSVHAVIQLYSRSQNITCKAVQKVLQQLVVFSPLVSDSLVTIWSLLQI